MRVASGTPASSAASAGASVRMSAHHHLGLQFPDGREGVTGGLDDGLVEVQRLGAGGEDPVLGGGREA